MFLFNTNFFLYPVDQLASHHTFWTRGIYRRRPVVATITVVAVLIMVKGEGDTGAPPHPIAAKNHLLPPEQQVVWLDRSLRTYLPPLVRTRLTFYMVDQLVVFNRFFSFCYVFKISRDHHPVCVFLPFYTHNYHMCLIIM